MDISPEVNRNYKKLQGIIRECGRMAIAFSGGADSSLLLKVASDTLGRNVLALFADSLLQPDEERQGAIATARSTGVALTIVVFNPFGLPNFIANGKDRCYHCKKFIFSAFAELAKDADFPVLADGTNLDDLGQDRPGLRATAELGTRSPLAEAGLTKGEIRQLSRALGLPTWNKPSASCLATRIPHGIPITADDLAVVDKAERYLHGLNYLGCRVRLAGTTAHLELAAGDIARLVQRGELEAVRGHLSSLGVKKVLLDLSERGSILS